MRSGKSCRFDKRTVFLGDQHSLCKKSVQELKDGKSTAHGLIRADDYPPYTLKVHYNKHLFDFRILLPDMLYYRQKKGKP